MKQIKIIPGFLTSTLPIGLNYKFTTAVVYYLMNNTDSVRDDYVPGCIATMMLLLPRSVHRSVILCGKRGSLS